MTYRGHVHNGAIILDEAAALPDGMEVVVSALTDEIQAGTTKAKSDRWMGRYKGTAEVPDLEESQSIRKEMWPEK
jgi:hypothetical protein